MSQNLHYNTVLSIAGSDSSGGAGIQADIKTCQTLGVYAMTAITALTAQNTQGVRCVLSTPSDNLEAQIEAVVTDIRPDAVKIGMVPDVASADVIVDCIERFDITNVVLDPVMVATSGDALSCTKVMNTMLQRLTDRITVLTPNIPEARALTGIEIPADADLTQLIVAAAEAVGCSSVLLKGGHSQSNMLTDVLYYHGQIYAYSHPRIETENTHGTGCSLSSAIAAFLAKGFDVPEACAKAIEWLTSAIEQGSRYSIGHGHGPICHFCMLQESAERPEIKGKPN